MRIMQESAHVILSEWGNFYVIIGSASAALTGLVFVVITLVSGMRQQILFNPSSNGVSIYSTPTVIYFCMTLFIAVLFSAPWQSLWEPCLLLGLASVGGLVYDSIILRRLMSQTEYTPVLEDWSFHLVLPFIAFITLLVASFVITFVSSIAMFFVGAASILFLFIGIHNSWDTVTYMTIAYVERTSKVQSQQESGEQSTILKTELSESSDVPESKEESLR